MDGERDGALVRFEHVTLGTVAVSPDATEARDAVERARRTAALMAAWTGPGATSDGHPVSILANVQDGAAARARAVREYSWNLISSFVVPVSGPRRA